MLRKLVVFALIGLMVTPYFVFDLGQYLNQQTLKAQQASIEAYRARDLGLAAAIYFTLHVLITAPAYAPTDPSRQFVLDSA